MDEKQRKKYKDPKWKRRSDWINNKDGHICKKCGEKSYVLNTHHLDYGDWGSDPWDLPDEVLITLCDKCHAEETEIKKKTESVRKISRLLKMHFWADELEIIWRLLWRMKYRSLTEHRKKGGGDG